jgi:UDP-GlcNAc:undecaprenyl-phosphate GlcNAc-1-phosphate transferase
LLLLAVVGYLDDRNQKGISPYWRLIINVVVGGVIFFSGWAIRYVTNPFGGIILFGGGTAFLVTVMWLTWMQNVVGWSSGVDGQLPGFVVIAAIAIAVMSRQENNFQALILAAITAGAYLGFLPWNFFPQKIMPGYGGKSMAGLLLGLVAMLSVARVGAMAMVLGLPFVDAFWVIIKRISEGRSPVWGGREHLHHYLLDIGWSRRKISLFYWLVSAVLAVGAIQLKATAWYFTMTAVVLVISGVILWVKSLSGYSKQPGPGSG